MKKLRTPGIVKALNLVLFIEIWFLMDCALNLVSGGDFFGRLAITFASACIIVAVASRFWPLKAMGECLREDESRRRLPWTPWD